MMTWISGVLAFGLSCFLLVGCGEGSADENKRVFAAHESEAIKSAEYDKMAQKLTLTLKDDTVEVYTQVPSALATELLSGEAAPDKVYNQKIKSKYLKK